MEQAQKTTNEMTITPNYKNGKAEEKAAVCTNLEEVQEKTNELSLKDKRETTVRFNMNSSSPPPAEKLKKSSVEIFKKFYKKISESLFAKFYDELLVIFF